MHRVRFLFFGVSQFWVGCLSRSIRRVWGLHQLNEIFTKSIESRLFFFAATPASIIVKTSEVNLVHSGRSACFWPHFNWTGLKSQHEQHQEWTCQPRSPCLSASRLAMSTRSMPVSLQLAQATFKGCTSCTLPSEQYQMSTFPPSSPRLSSSRLPTSTQCPSLTQPASKSRL